MAERIFVKFEPKQIAETASFIRTQQGMLVQNIESIQQLSNTLKQSWSSDDRADKFYEAASLLHSKGEKLANELMAMATGLNQSSGLYSSGESAAEKGVQTLPTEGVFRT